MNQRHERAVVIGAGISGLLAARVLCDYFDEVTLIERDQLPEQPGSRKGVPQARHVHQLLTGGLQHLNRLFPGFGVDLAAHGAVPINWPGDMVWYSPIGLARSFASHLNTFACSRDLLEWLVRRRLLTYRNLVVRTSTDVIGLLGDQQAVTGVKLRARGEHRDEEWLHADLVVDTSGRGSRLTEWLAETGVQVPADTVVNSFLGYASRIYQPPTHPTFGAKILAITTVYPNTRSGVLFPLEGGRWFVTLSGYARDYPPTDEAGFLDFVQSLPYPALYQALRDATPLAPIAGYQRTENRLRHFETVANWPRGLIALGDVVCSFNPVYGQGMANAARSAIWLSEWLASWPRKATTRDFQRGLAANNEAAWNMSTGVDFGFPTTEGTPRRSIPGVSWYMNRVFRLTTFDPVVAEAFHHVMHLVRPPSSLFQPKIASRVLGWNGTIASPLQAMPIE